MPAILTLIKNPLTNEFDSTLYFKAAGEVFAFLIAGSWVLTILFNPSVIEDNAITRRVGYNNVCVGFDTPPAKYFAFFMWPVVHYFNIRAAWLEIVTEYSLDEARTSNTGKLITVVASGLLVVSVLLQTFILVFPPEEGFAGFYVWLHTGFFVQYMVLRLIFVAAQFFKNRFDASSEDEDSITSGQWTYFYVYMFVTLAYTMGVFCDFYYYDILTPEGSDVLIPWYYLNALDVLWFVTMAIGTKFLPAHHTYRIKSVAKAQMKELPTE